MAADPKSLAGLQVLAAYALHTDYPANMSHMTILSACLGGLEVKLPHDVMDTTTKEVTRGVDWIGVPVINYGYFCSPNAKIHLGYQYRQEPASIETAVPTFTEL
jgi:hypothetical protein